MKKYMLLIISTILMGINFDNIDTNIQDGLYFGKKGRFVPPVLIFATYKNPTFYLECYLHEKGEYIAIKKDTLNYNNSRFEGNNCLIYMENGKIYFLTTESATYKIRKTKIEYSPENEEYLNRIRSKSRINWIKRLE